MTRSELQLLIDAAMDGDISEADCLRLEAELSVDPAARREYYDRVTLTLLLEAEAAETPPSAPSVAPQAVSARLSERRRKATFAALVAACAALLLIVVWQRGVMRNGHHTLSTNSAPDDVNNQQSPIINRQSPSTLSSPPIKPEHQSSGFAVLSGQADAVWLDHESLVTGNVVPPGELHLSSGVAQFELFSGVTIVVEGDARFSILSPMEVALSGGKLRARVPEPAHGFRVLTDAGQVVDLGTEFAVNVTADSSEVHVLDGEVEWHPQGLPSRRLLQGDAARSDDGKQIAIAANATEFVGPSDVRERLRTRRESRFERWEQESRSLADDPRLIAHYQTTPERISQRRLPNLASGSTVVAGQGAIVAAVPASNRWGQPDSALDFSPAGSRVRLQVPGEFQDLTLIGWVRINSLDRWYNSLFLTDGHELGEPHWQIMDDGRLFFSVKKNDVWDAAAGQKDKHVFYSPPFWNSSLSGRWLMLATVYDGTDRRVTHYLNGELLSTEEIPAEYLVTEIHVGDASLCNWGLPERNQPRFAIRNLNGSLDEFLMFRAPLSAAEIQKFYEDGRP